MGDDDYLTIRAANPRTGVVTPSAWKWRQRDNGWISLPRDQVTPVDWSGRGGVVTTTTTTTTPPARVSVVPGEYPVTPAKDTGGERIRRKPVGSGWGMSQSGYGDYQRSSSAPTPRRRGGEYFAPEDVGGRRWVKELPPVPPAAGDVVRRRRRRRRGEPGTVVDWVEDVPIHVLPSGSRELPGLQGNGAAVRRTGVNNGNVEPMQTRINGQHQDQDGSSKPVGPRGGDETYPYVRRLMLRRQQRNTDRMVPGLPPVTPDGPRRRKVIQGPREMLGMRTMIGNQVDDVFTGPPQRMVPTVRKDGQKPILELCEGSSQLFDRAFACNTMPAMRTMDPARAGGVRPRMPTRTEETRHIPRLADQRWYKDERTRMIDPGNRPQWVTSASKDRRTDGRKAGVVVSVGGDETVPLRRICSRCGDGFVEVRNEFPSTDEREEVPHMHRENQMHGMRVGASTMLEQRAEDSPARPAVIGGEDVKGEKETTVEPEKPGSSDYTIAVAVAARENPRTINPIANWNGRLGDIEEDDLHNHHDVQEEKAHSHTSCCPECCQEEDCHGGCLGHPSPSPTRSVQSLGSETTLVVDNDVDDDMDDRQTKRLSNEKVRGAAGAGFVRTNFKKSADGSPRQNSRAGEIPPPSNPKAALWGGDGSGGVLVGAVAAAKSAMWSDLRNSRVDGARKGNETWVRKRQLGHRHQRRIVTEPALDTVGKWVDGSGDCQGDAEATTNANEGKKRTASGGGVSSSSLPESRTVRVGSRRKVSEGMESVFNVLAFPSSPSGLFSSGDTAIGFPLQVRVLGELFILPIRVAWMWIRQHPEIVEFGWKVVARLWEMVGVIARTWGKIWEVAYIYSRTGRVRVRASSTRGRGGSRKGSEGGAPELIWDVLRSCGYAGLLLAVGVLVGRVLGLVWAMVRGVVGVIGLIGWVLGRIIGISW